jgi:hypothetical protein
MEEALMAGRALPVTGKRIVTADDEAIIRMGVRCILEDAVVEEIR